MSQKKETIRKYKIGDRLTCKPGFTTKCMGGVDPDAGGSGYKEGYTGEVRNITTSNEGNHIYWFGGSGIYEQALKREGTEELVNDYEIY